MIFIAKHIEDFSCSKSNQGFIDSQPKQNLIKFDSRNYQKEKKCVNCELVDACIYFKFFTDNFDIYKKAIPEINNIAKICVLFR